MRRLTPRRRLIGQLRSRVAAVILAVLIPAGARSELFGAETPAAGAPGQARARLLTLTDLDQRVPWTSSRVIGSPEPPPPFRIERRWPELKFKDPVDLCRAPAGDRLFLAEQAGKVYSFDPRTPAPQPELLVDLRPGRPDLSALYGIAFHPGFVTNRYVYLCYVLKDGAPDGTRVSRFRVAEGDPPRIEAQSEDVLITWLGGGHNGGALQFGPDGYLYISTGDGAGPNPPDPLRTGQDNSDLLSAILRIDVDEADEGKRYRIPADNPFKGRDGLRGEVWAYGLRNPWRMSFDRATGALWVADVGWELWEMVYRVEKGGNYGWSVVEGPQSIHPEWTLGPTPILPPVHSHPHTEAASISGGIVYHGPTHTNLAGAYIYGDWVTGKIWALRGSGQGAAVEELVDTALQVVCFGEDPRDGELIVVDYAGGLYQLTANAASREYLNFPRRLSETGLFASVKDHLLAPGVIPFAVNAEQWRDHAQAERFVGLPGTSVVRVGKGTPTDSSAPAWTFPTNSVLGRTFSMEMEDGHPETSRRLETQLLHFDGQDWHAYTYRWNEEQTDAALVDATGDTMLLQVKDPHAPEGQREQTWRFHSRAECLRCHNPWTGFALAFTGPQLERSASYAAAKGETVRDLDQLAVLSRLGCFQGKPQVGPNKRLVDPCDPNAELNRRARSWLHVNCSHCHREGAGGSVVSHFDIDSSMRAMKAVDQTPSQGTLGLMNARVIAPGVPFDSVLYYRISTTGPGRMPLIGSTEVDVSGVQLIRDWIRQLKGAEFAQPDDFDSALKVLADAECAPPAARAAVDSLLGSANGALALMTAMQDGSVHYSRTTLWRDAVAQHPSLPVRELFARFLPQALRPKRLGPDIKPQQILALKGDASRGRVFFFSDGAQCSRCHRINDQGRDFGPELSQAARKYSRAELLDQILNPSKVIDPAYRVYQAETRDESYSGLLLKRTAETVLLKDADLHEIQLSAKDLKSLQAQQLSAMPEGLLQAMSAQDAADLLEYLSSLR